MPRMMPMDRPDEPRPAMTALPTATTGGVIVSSDSRQTPSPATVLAPPRQLAGEQTPARSTLPSGHDRQLLAPAPLHVAHELAQVPHALPLTNWPRAHVGTHRPAAVRTGRARGQAVHVDAAPAHEAHSGEQRAQVVELALKKPVGHVAARVQTPSISSEPDGQVVHAC